MYNVSTKNQKGTCEGSLFEKMAKKGDITSTKLTEVLGQVATITGYAICEISTDDKTFNIMYVDTKEFGLVSSGSEIFMNSITEYYGEVDKVRFTEVKTKKGKTYKAVPILGAKEENEETTTDDLPF